jgi:site-specific DNA-methyltransferase (adenine-specific)
LLYFDCEKKYVHPTQKPLELMKYLVLTYSNEGDLVLDSCMGSGSTGVACKELNRNFIGIEIDTKYFEIACERLGVD